MLAFQAWIGVAADVIPGPAVESSVLNVGDVIRRQIVAQVVALIDRAPKFASFRLHGNADRIANAPGKHAFSRSVRVEFQDVGTVILGGIIIRVVRIGAGADRDIYFLSIARERDVARPVASTAQTPAARQLPEPRRRTTR